MNISPCLKPNYPFFDRFKELPTQNHFLKYQPPETTSLYLEKADSLKRGTFRIFQSIIAGKSNDGTLLLSVKGPNPFKNTGLSELYSSTFLEKPNQPITLKKALTQNQKNILDEIDFFQRALPNYILGVQPPLLGVLLENDQVNGYLVEGCFELTYKQYMESMETIPFTTLLSHLYQLTFGLLFLHSLEINHGNITPSHIIIDKGRLSLCFLDEDEMSPELEEKLKTFDLTNPEDEKKAFELFFKTDRFQLGEIFLSAYQKWTSPESNPCIELSNLLEKMVHPLETERPSLETLHEKIERIRFSYFSEPLQRSYERLSLQKGVPLIPPHDLPDLVETASEHEPGTFGLFRYKHNHKTLDFMAGKSKEGTIQIGLINQPHIGEGSFGKVFSCTFLDNEQIAIKISKFKKSDFFIQTELSILNYLHLDQESITGIQPPMLGSTAEKSLLLSSSFQKLPFFGCSMKLCRGDYLSYLEEIINSVHSLAPLNHRYFLSHQGVPLLQTNLSYLLQIIEGLTFIQEKKILHSDLRLENMFLYENGEVRIGDFGYAKNTSKRENPDPKTYKPDITSLKSLLELSSKDCENTVEREEAIEIALSMDRYQIGHLIYELCSWISSGYKMIIIPYELKEIANNCYYPRHFRPSLFAQTRKTISPAPFHLNFKLPPDLEKLSLSMIHADETKRPSLETVKTILKNIQKIFKSNS